MRIGTLKLVICVLMTFFTQFSLANCDFWTFEVTNGVTNEVKTYKYAVGDKLPILIPEMKKYNCSFEVQRPSPDKLHSSIGYLTCRLSNDSDVFITNADCFDGFSGSGYFSIMYRDVKTKKGIWYDLTFKPYSN